MSDIFPNMSDIFANMSDIFPKMSDMFADFTVEISKCMQNVPKVSQDSRRVRAKTFGMFYEKEMLPDLLFRGGLRSHRQGGQTAQRFLAALEMTSSK